MTKNEDISKPFKVIERQTLEVEHVVEKNKYFMILFFSQLYTQFDTCQKFHPDDDATQWITINNSNYVRLWVNSYVYLTSNISMFLYGICFITIITIF